MKSSYKREALAIIKSARGPVFARFAGFKLRHWVK